MKILVISGSQRANSKSSLVLDYLQPVFTKSMPDVEFKGLRVADYSILLNHYDNESTDQISEELDTVKKSVLDTIESFDAYIIIAPEWGGMIPPGLANLFLLSAYGSAGNRLPMAHKPSMVIGISEGEGGSNPVSILKAFIAKNTHVVWSPMHAVVRGVDDFLMSDWSPGKQGRINLVQSRILVGLRVLATYARAFAPHRETLKLLSSIHPYGQ